MLLLLLLCCCACDAEKGLIRKMLEAILLRTWTIVVAVITICVKEVNAFDGGDAAALIIGLVIGVLGICSCLGYYARRRAG